MLSILYCDWRWYCVIDRAVCYAVHVNGVGVMLLIEPAVTAQQTQQSQVVEVVWDNPVAR